MLIAGEEAVTGLWWGAEQAYTDLTKRHPEERLSCVSQAGSTGGNISQGNKQLCRLTEWLLYSLLIGGRSGRVLDLGSLAN